MQLRDDQWQKLKPMLVGRYTAWGINSRNCRQFINAMIFVVETKAKWVQLPAEFGHWRTVHMRFRRWNTIGQWEKMAEAVNGDEDLMNIFLQIAVFANSYTENMEQKQDRREELRKL